MNAYDVQNTGECLINLHSPILAIMYHTQQARGIVQTPDGGFLLSGNKGNGNTIGAVWKTDRQGNVEWEKTFSANGYLHVLISVILTSDGGCASHGFKVVPKPASLGGGKAEHSWVLKLDANGNTEADFTWGPWIGRWANSLGLLELEDGSFLSLGNYDAIPPPPGGQGIGGFDAQALKLALVETPGDINGKIFQAESTDICIRNEKLPLDRQAWKFVW